MNKMNKGFKKYKIVKDEKNLEDGINIGNLLMQYGMLAVLCLLAFLVAKYIVRSEIDGEKTPIDTSERI